jgi:hypothetical protein
MAEVAAVVDTKGVDAGGFNREDLDRYIREDKSAICILTEKFPAAPSNVLPLLQRHVTPETPLSLSKFALMVIPQRGEPENVVGAEGPVGERDVGIKLRTSAIRDTLDSRGLNDLRLLFYDPLQYFERDGGDVALRAGMTTDEVQAEREDVWKDIFASFKDRED